MRRLFVSKKAQMFKNGTACYKRIKWSENGPVNQMGKVVRAIAGSGLKPAK